MRPLTMLDLFSGIGGFSLAASWTGQIETVMFCEIEPYCQKVLKKHWPDVPIHSDIKTLRGEDVGAVDIVCGGFPCQPFSCAGKRRGKEDDRHLWPEMFRIIQETKPTWVVGENVANFVNMGLDDCISDLEAEGYEVQPLVIPACAVNAPHRRDRVWIVANRDGYSSGSRRPQTERQQREAGIANGCENVAYSGCRNKPGNLHERSHAASNRARYADQIERSGWTSLDVSNSDQQGLPPGRCTQQARSGIIGGYDIISNPFSSRLEIRDGTKGQRTHSVITGSDWWAVEPNVGRVAHGISHRVDRLRGCGNAIVPEVAYQILQGIVDIEEVQPWEYSRLDR